MREAMNTGAAKGMHAVRRAVRVQIRFASSHHRRVYAPHTPSLICVNISVSVRVVMLIFRALKSFLALCGHPRTHKQHIKQKTHITKRTHDGKARRTSSSIRESSDTHTNTHTAVAPLSSSHMHIHLIAIARCRCAIAVWRVARGH